MIPTQFSSHLGYMVPRNSDLLLTEAPGKKGEVPAGSKTAAPFLPPPSPPSSGPAPHPPSLWPLRTLRTNGVVRSTASSKKTNPF